MSMKLAPKLPAVMVAEADEVVLVVAVAVVVAMAAAVAVAVVADVGTNNTVLSKN